ncbi:MAG: hypothetical protein K1Y36_05375 [Blastocatellia bacterium]|nr:hypothetical protein [Blastocatellia bacterium]
MISSALTDRSKQAIFYGIGLICLASLLFELTLTRIFSVVMYYHFAFMVISLAMFGFGVSGLLAYLKPNWFPLERLGKRLWFHSVCFSVTIILSLLIVLQAQVDLSFKQENIIKLVVIYLVAAIPFFFVGVCVSIAMTHLSDVIGKLYFYDLLGASLGCVVAIPVMNVLGGPGAVLVAALMAALGALCFANVAREEMRLIGSPTNAQSNPFVIGTGLLLVCFGLILLGSGFSTLGGSYLAKGQYSSWAVMTFLIGLVLTVSGSQPRGRRYKLLPLTLAGVMVVAALVNLKVEFIRVIFSKGHQEQNIVFSEWNSFSRISVEADPGGSHTMRIDADAATHVVRTSGKIVDDKPFRQGISGAAYHLREGVENVLVIGPGGGWDIATAVAHHAKNVTACEINPIIVNSVMKGQFKEYSGGLYEFPNVHVHVGEGRSFVRNSNQKFDIIQATLVDTWAATAGGALSLTENNLYTVEAFEDYLNHLSDTGMITMTRWLIDTDQQNLRLVSLGLEALSRLKATNPEGHFMLVASGKGLEATNQRICTFLLKRTPFTEAEIHQMEADCAKNEYSILYSPLAKMDNSFTKLITAKDRAAFYQDYRYDITPTFDNKPFFFFTLKPKDFLNAFSGDYEMMKNNAGLLALVSLLGIVFVLSSLFIIVPLVLFKRDALRTDTFNRVRVVLYFAALGIGFMAIEMALLQKFVFFLGHPVYALAVVLFSILLFSSLGSNYTERVAADTAPSFLQKLVGVLCVLTVVYLFLLPTLLYTFVGLAVPLKIVISIALLSPIAFLMGMPLPLGIKTIRQRAAEMIPWGWGVNGAMSVLGSVLAVTLAVNLGYNALLVFGAGVYVLAAITLPGKLGSVSAPERETAVEIEAQAQPS